MPQRFSLLLVLFGILLPGQAQSPARAQSTRRAQSATQPVIRYHFGDNPAWAAPSFNDSSWPIAQKSAWPLPPLHSSGFSLAAHADPRPARA